MKAGVQKTMNKKEDEMTLDRLDALLLGAIALQLAGAYAMDRIARNQVQLVMAPVLPVVLAAILVGVFYARHFW